MKTVIEMAREAGLVGGPVYARGLECFAELVRADEREQGQKWFDAVTAQHKQAILAEREACAKLCERMVWIDGSRIPSNISLASAIRARGSNT